MINCIRYLKRLIPIFFLRFHVSNKYFALDNLYGWVNISPKQKPIKRYYAYKEKDYGDGNIEVQIEEDCLTKNKMLLKIPKQNDEKVEQIELNSIKCENNLTLLTSEYNKQLSENPSDIDLWIKFVNYQVRSYLI